ncbi:MAG TPA: SelB C-terminal domain-containing protein, partial [Polyangiaceae bacterium]|nr:SelB C-terminal domain-containing protein [Polyangiaceae bacterium]
TRDFGRILGGGRVLDALAPPPPRRRGAAAFEQRAGAARALARGDLSAGLLGLVRCRAPRPLVEADVERRLGLEPGSAAALLAASASRGLAVRLGDHPLWTTPDAVEGLARAAVDLLRRHHAQAPHEPGAPIETIRTALVRTAGREAAAHALDAALASGRVRPVDPGRVCLPEFADASARSHDEAVEKVRAALDAVGLEGAGEQEIAGRSGLAPERARAALARLAQAGEARRLSGLWFGEERLAGLRAAVRDHLRHHATMSVPAFKQLFSVSRKQAIPLLEDLDHQGVTRRQGDDRVLGPAGGK